jgi:hypothetical protein
VTIIESRLALLDNMQLDEGKHNAIDEGVCLVEAASWLAGEPFSDHPACVCPVIGAFCRSWNDSVQAEDRNRLLKPYAARIVGTVSTADVQDARAFMAADWAVRTFTPAWLRLAGLDTDAQALVDLPELSTVDLCRTARLVIAKAQKSAAAAGAAAWAAAGDAAWAAAWDAAWDAAWAAAGDAAWAAAGAAAGDAAGAAAWDAAWAAAWAAAGDAAWAAAWAAAGDAAWAAAWAAARDAARDALRQTVIDLQGSACDLLDRMIAVTA